MTTLEFDREQLDRATTKLSMQRAGAAISMQAALEAVRDDAGVRERLIAVLRDAPYAGYFWEHPPITQAALARPFECVLVDAPGLARARPEPNAFAQYFGRDEDGDGVVVFENLGRDATLVVPCPLVSPDAYPHLAAFVRGAPELQVHALLRCVAREALARASARSLWLSTAGMGVYWLHVRLDTRPKYYRHTPYTVHHG